MTGRQGAQKFQGGPETLCAARNYFLLNISQISYLYGYFYKFQQIYASKECIWSEIGFYDAKNQTLRPIFAAARKKYFGKVVTLS